MIYLDHSATTPIDPEVLKRMLPFLGPQFGNPSGLHRLARQARRAVEQARDTIAQLTGASRVVFTSGGTEGLNQAIIGLARLAGRPKLVTSRVEHRAVLAVFERLQQEGFEVAYVPVDDQGRVSPKALLAEVGPETGLVSLQLANNEIGTVQPVEEIARRLPEGTFFHCDGVQGVGRLDCSLESLGVDCLTLSGHKFYGPKGIGCNLLGPGVELPPLLVGGGQEGGARSGTEHVAGVVGLAAALQISVRAQPSEEARLKRLARDFLDALEPGDGLSLTGSPERLPGHLSFLAEGVHGESLVVELDRRDIATSTGSACSVATGGPSHVLLALGVSQAQLHSGLRMVFGRSNSRSELEQVLECLRQSLRRLRCRV